MKLPHCVVLLTMFAALGANAEAECPYLPTESAPAIEFSLPTGLLKDFSVEMPPLFFEGFNPKVVRKTLPFGSPPKITIERYSSQPSITYDEVEGAVVIRSQQCVAQTRSASVSSRRLPWMGLAVSVLFGITSENAGSVAMPATMFSLMAASLLPKASAQDDACLPSVKVVVEAPAGTMDAVEQCWAEVENPEDICPDPFPTFPTCEDAEVECQVVVVGAATGGLYAATR